MPQTPDVVIEATLKAACIRASASLFLGYVEFDQDQQPESHVSIMANQRLAAERVVAFAAALYEEATRVEWKRGDAK